MQRLHNDWMRTRYAAGTLFFAMCIKNRVLTA
jgi:hypothetical protein